MAQLRTNSIKEYVKLLDKGGGPNLNTDRYSGAFNTAVDDNITSLIKSIIRYAEHTTAAKEKFSNLEVCLAIIKLSASQSTCGPP